MKHAKAVNTREFLVKLIYSLWADTGFWFDLEMQNLCLLSNIAISPLSLWPGPDASWRGNRAQYLPV